MNSANKLKVLLVDDEEKFSHLMANVLRLNGFEPIILESSKQLHQIDAKSISAAVVDLHLETWDGTEALEALAELEFSGLIITVTGMSECVLKAFSEHAQKLGLNWLCQFKKPFSLRSLMNSLQHEKNLISSKLKRPFIPKKAIESALDNKEFNLLFQPQYRLSDQTCCGVETLARWTKSKWGFIPPDHFVPLIDNYDLQNNFNRFVISEAIDQFAASIFAQSMMSLSINISVHSLSDPLLPKFIQIKMQEHGLEPSRLTIEVTEDSLLGANDTNELVLHRLRDLGVRLSLDDFGTGFSSLKQLSMVQFDELKLDKCFVQRCLFDEPSRVVLETSMSIAEKLNLDLVLEGIETDEQERFLQKLGCPIGQGFLFGKPLSIKELEATDYQYDTNFCLASESSQRLAAG